VEAQPLRDHLRCDRRPGLRIERRGQLATASDDTLNAGSQVIYGSTPATVREVETIAIVTGVFFAMGIPGLRGYFASRPVIQPR
jgi:hypothetical protein